MASVQITCITKAHSLGGHEHITHVGNTSARWSKTKEQVIHLIDTKANSFFVVDPYSGKRSEVGVVRPIAGPEPFLRTYADSTWNDNLLSLPPC